MKKTRVTHEGQSCRKCKTPVVRIFRKNNTVKPGQKYYYKSYLTCKKCKSMYMLESEKVFVDGTELIKESVKKSKNDRQKDEKIKRKLIRRESKRRTIQKKLLKRRNLYKEYLNSSDWKMFRETILSERGNFCESCNMDFHTSKLHIHHIHYNNFTRELRQDVLILCEKCHENMHETVKSPPYTIERMKN